jgi:hypothetical protein
VTVRIRRGLPSLREGRFLREIEHSFRIASERGNFRLVQYSLQRDHVHLLVEADGPRALGCGMASLGARIARAVNRVFRRRVPVFDDRFHHRLLGTPREVRNALRYVLLDARKHAAGWLRRSDRAGIDPASSGRWFEHWTRETLPPKEPPPVARPRSWLFRAGWLRHGRIDPADVPGAKK